MQPNIPLINHPLAPICGDVSSEEKVIQFVSNCSIVSRETMEQFYLFSELLQKWNRHINLVAPHSLTHIWQRHILDSLQLYNVLDDIAKPILDLGSGAGFPGIVLAILGCQVVLVESDQKKCSFLQEVQRKLALSFDIKNVRIEALSASTGAIWPQITARALAPMEILLEHTQKLLAPSGHFYFLKGKQWKEELTNASDCWKLTYKISCYASLSSSEGVILKGENI